MTLGGSQHSKQGIAINLIKDGKNNGPDGKKQGALLSLLKVPGEEPGFYGSSKQQQNGAHLDHSGNCFPEGRHLFQEGVLSGS